MQKYGATALKPDEKEQSFQDIDNPVITQQSVQVNVAPFYSIQEQKSEHTLTLRGRAKVVLHQTAETYHQVKPHIRTLTHVCRGLQLAQHFKEVYAIPLGKAPLISRVESLLQAEKKPLLNKKTSTSSEDSTLNLSSIKVIYNEFSPSVSPYVMKTVRVIFNNLTKGASCIAGTISLIQCKYVNKQLDDKKIKITAVFNKMKRGNNLDAENNAILIVEPVRFLTNFGQGILNGIEAQTSWQHKSLGQLVTITSLAGFPGISKVCNFVHYIPKVDATIKAITSLANFGAAGYAARFLYKAELRGFLNHTIANLAEISIPEFPKSEPWPSDDFEYRVMAYGALKQTLNEKTNALTEELIKALADGVKKSTRGVIGAAGTTLSGIMLGVTYGLPDLPVTCDYPTINVFEPYYSDYISPLKDGYNDPLRDGNFSSLGLVTEKISWDLLTYFSLSIGSTIAASFIGGVAKGTVKFWLDRHKALIEEEIEKRLIKNTEKFMFNEEEIPRLTENSVMELMKRGVEKRDEIVKDIAEMQEDFADVREFAAAVSIIGKAGYDFAAPHVSGSIKYMSGLSKISFFNKSQRIALVESKKPEPTVHPSVKTKEVCTQIKAHVSAAVTSAEEALESAGEESGRFCNKMTSKAQQTLVTASNYLLLAIPNAYCNVCSNQEDIREDRRLTNIPGMFARMLR